MKFRLPSIGIVAVVMIAGAIVWQRSYGFSDQARPDRQARPRVMAEPVPVPAGQGRKLSFDVRPADYQSTTRYVLEITDSSGKVTTVDLKKPSMERRSIAVLLPELVPGRYSLIVIAEGSAGSSRSRPLAIEVQGKERHPDAVIVK